MDCAELDTNPAHCGRCGHDCQGGTCAAGVCQSFVLVAASASDIAVDATNLYWSTNTMGTIEKVPLRGGAPSTLVSGQVPTYSLAVDATNVYWNGTAVMKAPLAGGAPSVVDGVVALGRIKADATSIYYQTKSAIWSISPDGTGSKMLASEPGTINYFAVGGSDIAWITGLTARSAPITGGAPTLLASNAPANGIAADATNVYWGAGRVQQCAASGCNDQPLTLAMGKGVIAIATDGKFVYFTNQLTIERVPVDGGEVQTLATSSAQPVNIRVDDTSVYWTTNGAIMKVALPSPARSDRARTGPSRRCPRRSPSFRARSGSPFRRRRSPSRRLRVPASEHGRRCLSPSRDLRASS